MTRTNGAMRVKDGKTLPTQDDSRPVNAVAFSGSFMLNNCRECGLYKYVYCNVDLGDGKGPGYICGRCRREARERR
jgi:hypothetical protein